MNTQANIFLRGSEIHIRFPYNQRLVEKAHTVQDCEWNGADLYWHTPATSWHCRQVIRAFDGDLEIAKDVRNLAFKDQKDYEHSTWDLSIGDLRPRPYQAGAVEFLYSIGGRWIIGDDVGLGKTIEAIAYARFIGTDRFLVVCPASVLYKWERAIQAWYPEVKSKVSVIASGKTPIQGTVHVISYDMMRRRYTELLPLGYKLIFFDECHKLRNYKTLQFKAANILARGIPQIVGLSGTILINRPSELFNILNILDPKVWQWYPFHNRYCGFTQKGDGVQGADNLPELRERLRGIMLSRHKRQVASQLPPFTRTVVPVQVEADVMENYRRLESADPAMVQKLCGKPAFHNHLDWLSALRQFLEQARATSIKDWAVDFLDGSDEKLVIFCGYKNTVRYLRSALESWGVLEITGDLSGANRQAVIDRWQLSGAERVMLITSAGSEAVDLFGKNGINCSTVLFAGREWSPALEKQIEGRVDRIGQSFPTTAVYLVLQNTIDEHIDQLIETKRQVINAATGAPDTSITIIDDLMDLLYQRGIVPKEILHEGLRRPISESPGPRTGP